MASDQLKIYARHVSGGVYNSDQIIDKPATDCFYVVGTPEYDSSVVKVFLNSDYDASANFGFTIPKSELPLQDGAEFEKYNYTISYKRGVLTAIRHEIDGIQRQKTSISITIDPNLTKPVEASAVETIANLFRSMKFKELNCRF
jgi:hypothetical protein